MAGEQFYNTSRFDFATLIAAPDDLADNLKHYVASFSASARDVLDKFDFTTQIDRLDRSKLLYLVMSKFADDRPAPRQGFQPGDGLPVRGADPEVLRAVQRDGG
ncbi:MAG: type I restriction-modification system subunit M N-terminal domain-containing protein [Nocardioides sp.]